MENMKNIIKQINEVGKRVFYNPDPLVKNYDEIIENSLGSNTYRAFHRIDKTNLGASVTFKTVLEKNKELIIDSLNGAKCEKDLGDLENKICELLKSALEGKIKKGQLESFNKLKKPVNLIIQHLVSMYAGVNPSVRKELTQHLFLPLDSQIFQSHIVFSDDDLKTLNIRRSFSFGRITDKNHYYVIQKFLKEKAKNAGIENRIYYDLIWGERYKSTGTNLIMTNP